MAKDDLKLDDELNDNLDFLEDHELNLDQNNGYLSSNQSANSNKTKLITIGVIIGIIVFIVSMQFKKKFHHTTLATIPTEQPIPTTPTAPETQTILPPKHHQSHQVAEPSIAPEATNTALHPTISNPTHLSWQDLKKSVEETNTTPPLTDTYNPSNPTNFEIPLPVKGFEYTPTPQVTQSTQQTQPNTNTQESINELKTTIENITNDLTANVNQIKELQNNLKEISRSIGSVNSNINNVDSRILNLTNTVDNLSSNIKKYTQEEDLDLTAHVKPSEPDLFSNTPEYLVHAVIPGRAWLKSSSGQIITVAEGDSLGDYGKIALIDTANNLVRTSSGVVFR